MIILLRNPEKPVVEEGDGLEIDIDGMVIKCDVIVLLFSYSMYDVLTIPAKHTQCLRLEQFFLRSYRRETHLPIP